MSIKNIAEIVKVMMASGCSLEQVNAVLAVHVKADEEAQEKKLGVTGGLLMVK